MENIDTVGLIRQELLNLKCILCSNFLTVSPILMTISENEYKYKCGRCKDIKSDGTLVVNEIFENVAKHLRFPCTFENCEENLEWVDIQDHERVCTNRKYSCPLRECEARFRLSEFKTHIAHVDETFIHEIDTELFSIACSVEGTEVESQVHFIELEEVKFLLFIHKQLILLVSLSPINSYQEYSITFSEDGQNLPRQKFCLSFENQKIAFYDEKIHCLDCFSRTCTSRIHPNSTINSSELQLELIYSAVPNWDQILTVFSEPINLNIQLRKQTLDISVQHLNALNVAHFSELRKTLECIVCMQIMENFYNCQLGHSVCNNCTNQVTHCPTCRNAMTNSRNYSFEQILQVQFPCKYWVNGCIVMGLVHTLVNHEVSCPKKIQNV